MSRVLQKSAAAFATLGLLCNSALADNLAYSFNVNAQSWFTTLKQRVKLSNSGALQLAFTNPTAGLVSVTFTAECQLIAPTLSWLGVDIFIDGSIVEVTNGDDALCAGRGANVPGGWSRHSITVARVLAAGAHAVRVDAGTSGLHSGAQLDDVTLLIAR